MLMRRATASVFIFHTQVVLYVYLQYISAKIHSKCASQSKVAKKSLTTHILGVQGRSRSAPCSVTSRPLGKIFLAAPFPPPSLLSLVASPSYPSPPHNHPQSPVSCEGAKKLGLFFQILL